MDLQKKLREALKAKKEALAIVHVRTDPSTDGAMKNRQTEA
jgi:hypothetical protein